jgi:hypothetical protein
MATDTEAAAFRQQAEAQGLVLRTPDGEEPRFVFELKAGTIVTSTHAKMARQLMLLAEALYAPDRGEARELARLVARRDALEDEDSITLVVWRHAASAHAADPDRYDRKEWISFEDWLKDQFLLEDALASWDEGVPI